MSFSVTTNEPTVSNACPNDKWTADVVRVNFSSGSVRVIQGSFDRPSLCSNGISIPGLDKRTIGRFERDSIE